MPQKCAESGCPNLTDSGICMECSAEIRWGTPSEYIDDEDDVEADGGYAIGSYGIPLAVADGLEDADGRLCWRPDASLRVMLADLRGEFPAEWMLESARQEAFSSAREIRGAKVGD